MPRHCLRVSTCTNLYLILYQCCYPCVFIPALFYVNYGWTGAMGHMWFVKLIAMMTEHLPKMNLKRKRWKTIKLSRNISVASAWFFLRCFRDPIRVPRIENWVPRIRENNQWVSRIRENRVPRIRGIGSLHVHIVYVTFPLKKTGTNKFNGKFSRLFFILYVSAMTFTFLAPIKMLMLLQLADVGAVCRSISSSKSKLCFFFERKVKSKKKTSTIFQISPEGSFPKFCLFLPNFATCLSWK